MSKKSPLNYLNFWPSMAQQVQAMGKRKKGGSKGRIMAKLDQISSQLTNMQGGGSVAGAAPAPVSGTAGEANPTDPGSIADVSPTMVDPTEVEESMLGDNEIPTKNQPALMMLRNMVKKSPLHNPSVGYEHGEGSLTGKVLVNHKKTDLYHKRRGGK